jgi:hypothetical protein
MADESSPPPDGVALIAAERELQRQIWSDEHDDGHTDHEIVMAAVSYAMFHGVGVPQHWPWQDDHWRPTGSDVKDLAKAGALIAAEIDRLQRAAS